MEEEWGEGLDLLAYWYMAGVEDYGFGCSQANRALNERNLEWEEEENRRLEEEEVYDVIPKRYRHLILSEPRRLERQFGPRWVCRQCKAEYRVKTQFHKLYCSECLGPLRCRRLFPKAAEEPGSWILDDDLRR